MKLFKWVEGIKPKFPNIIENLFGKKISDKASEGENVSTVPSVNVESNKKDYQIEVAVPGLEKDDIKINVDGNVLSISSEKEYSNEEKGRNFIRQEFGYAAFCRSFNLPDGVDENSISAKLDKGILKISIPATEKVSKNVKQIKID